MMYKGTNTVPSGSGCVEELIVHLGEVLDYQLLCYNYPYFPPRYAASAVFASI